MVQFLFQNKRLLSFGVILTLFSSMGQTFLLSLFLPFFIEEFELTKTLFGALFSLATLGAALILLRVGKLIDQVPLKKFGLLSGLGLVVSAFVMFATVNIPMLFIGLLGVRLSAQGLLAHTSETTMARYFDQMRGKALSIASLGYSIGEAIMPLLIAFLLNFISWRVSWLVLCGLVLLILLPLIWALLNKDLPVPEQMIVQQESQNKVWTQRAVLRDWRYYFLLPSFITSPFLLSGFFLYQIPIAEIKGWSPEWVASSFIGFALMRSVASLIAGPLVDKFTAARIYPFSGIPIMIGMIGLALSNSIWAAPGYLMCAGFTMGFVNSAKSAITAELYGVQTLGAVRSLNASFTIFATATAPVLFGWLIDSSVDLIWIGFGAALLLMIGVIASVWVVRTKYGKG